MHLERVHPEPVTGQENENVEIEKLKEKSLQIFTLSQAQQGSEITVDKPLVLAPGVYFYKNNLIYTSFGEAKSLQLNSAQYAILRFLQMPQPIEELVESNEHVSANELREWFEFWVQNQIIINYNS